MILRHVVVNQWIYISLAQLIDISWFDLVCVCLQLAQVPFQKCNIIASNLFRHMSVSHPCFRNCQFVMVMVMILIGPGLFITALLWSLNINQCYHSVLIDNVSYFRTNIQYGERLQIWTKTHKFKYVEKLSL